MSPNGIGSINMSVEINGTIYAGEKELLLGMGREPGWWCRVGRGEGGVLPGAGRCQSTTHTTCLA